ncbi:MAG TPA: hypothetical protein PLI58_03415, partial [Candidatus Syntrophosphaera sp.]|nr:hypothetical protein [Candidatus Syntrophosphaera sp.]HOH48318.1 hypothetical protein [Candidatus Syntrophosphaera sp.]HPW38874.1 hypothetical protein [Candidatus Syntrophosphaera sp.]HPX66637.1 hypothetical protein [Candidatus Syntrophosphaera sp.]HQC47032.1 hypothetical protein [Candidatus Syntrophosphaera sp.]
VLSQDQTLHHIDNMNELTRAFPLIPTLYSGKDLSAEIHDCQAHVQTFSESPLFCQEVFFGFRRELC